MDLTILVESTTTEYPQRESTRLLVYVHPLDCGSTPVETEKYVVDALFDKLGRHLLHVLPVYRLDLPTGNIGYSITLADLPVAQSLRDALVEAKGELEWYRQEYPEAVRDRDVMRRIDVVLDSEHLKGGDPWT